MLAALIIFMNRYHEEYTIFKNRQKMKIIFPILFNAANSMNNSHSKITDTFLDGLLSSVMHTYCCNDWIKTIDKEIGGVKEKSSYIDLDDEKYISKFGNPSEEYDCDFESCHNGSKSYWRRKGYNVYTLYKIIPPSDYQGRHPSYLHIDWSGSIYSRYMNWKDKFFM